MKLKPHSGRLCEPPSENAEENRDRDRWQKQRNERQRAQTKQIKKEMWFDDFHFHIRYNGVKT